MSEPKVALDLVAVARRAAARGWVPATSGNFSARLGPDRFLVTPSGADKGTLAAEDLVEVDARGIPLRAGARASAETVLHLARYAGDAGVGAVVHVHAPRAVIASRRFREAVVLDGYELVKAFAGVTTHETRVVVPVVDNDQDLARLAPVAEAAVARAAPTWGYLVRGHGLYAWGADALEADRHAEALDALFHYVLEEGP